MLQDSMVLHYENNSPFLSVTRLERTLEVSHWGNIAVEEVVDVVHTGAQLKGPFSRYEYQREAQSGVSSVKSFKVSKSCNLTLYLFPLFLHKSIFQNGMICQKLTHMGYP